MTTTSLIALSAPKRRQRIFRFSPGAFSLCVLLVLLIIWQVVCTVFSISPSMLPAPTAIAAELVANFPLLWKNALLSLRVIGLGFLASLVFGFALGAAIGLSPRLAAALNPLMITSQAIPVIAIAPLIIVWAGYGLNAALIITVLMAFFPIMLNTAHGLASLDRDYTALGKSMGASYGQMLLKFRLPNALPEIYSGLKQGAVFSVVGAVVAEFIASDGGLGYMIVLYTGQFKTALVFAALFLLSLVGVGAFYLIVLLERLTIPWYRAVTA